MSSSVSKIYEQVPFLNFAQMICVLIITSLIILLNESLTLSCRKTQTGNVLSNLSGYDVLIRTQIIAGIPIRSGHCLDFLHKPGTFPTEVGYVRT